MYIKDLLKDKDKYLNTEVTLNGWIRLHRKQKDFGFIDLSDGMSFKHIQVVYEKSLENYEEIEKLLVGACISVKGKLIKSLGNEDVEISATSIEILGLCPEDYPIQAKRHTKEFLRENAYLRMRTNMFQAVFRIRSLAAMAIHEYFQGKGFLYVHTPIITASDCEGAGEMFKVTTLDFENGKKVDYKDDYFGKKAGLTVSGQLEAETFAMGFNKVYTFGPTFRAENSNTKYHISEFWMIEPEMAFCDLKELMDVEEECIKYIIKYCLEKAPDEFNFLDKFVENGLLDKLNKLIKSEFKRATHEEIITILKKADVKWEFAPEYGEDIQKEHEKYITEYFDGPVFIYNWPKDIKAFYMKQNEDGKTVGAVDLEVPGIGELIGGSQREEDYDKLLNRVNELGMNPSELEWYLNLRKFGTCTHSGFGIGFERLVMYLTGMENIRDVSAYPRTPNNCEF